VITRVSSDRPNAGAHASGLPVFWARRALQDDARMYDVITSSIDAPSMVPNSSCSTTGVSHSASEASMRLEFMPRCAQLERVNRESGDHDLDFVAVSVPLAATAGFRASRLREVGPPQLAAPHSSFHSIASNTFRAARRRNSTSAEDSGSANAVSYEALMSRSAWELKNDSSALR
jgi:hypothetical protein